MRNPFIRDATANESPTRLSYLSQAWGTVVTPLAHHPQRLISYNPVSQRHSTKDPFSFRKTPAPTYFHTHSEGGAT